MNNSKNKGGRPTKSKSSWACVPPSDPAFPALAQDLLHRLAADPTWSDSLEYLYGPIITGSRRSTPRWKSYVGAVTINVIEKAPVSTLEDLFRRIINIKKEAEKTSGQKHRHWHVLKGYLDYLSETENRQPSKPELKEYLIARKDIYKNLPDMLDKPGWTAAWKGAGLHELKDRKVRRKP